MGVVQNVVVKVVLNGEAPSACHDGEVVLSCHLELMKLRIFYCQ